MIEILLSCYYMSYIILKITDKHNSNDILILFYTFSFTSEETGRWYDSNNKCLTFVKFDYKTMYAIFSNIFLNMHECT